MAESGYRPFVVTHVSCMKHYYLIHQINITHCFKLQIKVAKSCKLFFTMLLWFLNGVEYNELKRNDGTFISRNPESAM